MSDDQHVMEDGFDDARPLEDKVCLVTGGGRGLGEATAVGLAARGATVVVNDLGTDLDGGGRTSIPAEETVERIERAGGTAMAHVGDVSSLSYTAELVSDVVDRYGRVDGAINFAGILRDAYITEMSEEAWDEVIEVHLKGHFTLLKNLAERWRSQALQTADPAADGDAARSFVAVTSPAALGNEGQVNYAAAKAGVLGLSRTAAAELSDFGIRTNAIMPIAHTRMTEQFIDTEEAPPERVPPVVAFLLSDAASDLNGLTVRVVGDSVGVVGDPELESVALRDGGWSVAELADLFESYPKGFRGGFMQ